jgi:hypothetical protein
MFNLVAIVFVKIGFDFFAASEIALQTCSVDDHNKRAMIMGDFKH